MMDKANEYLAACEAAITRAVETHFQAGSLVSSAANYSLTNGGKRVRGVFVLAVCDMLDGDAQVAADFAAAIEMVHAFSLIHDDLPCMDDDEMRRGKPACHIAYGTANALLAGDLLAIQAFEVIAGAKVSGEIRADATATLAHAAGARGMIYGQELDLYYENKLADAKTLMDIYRHKTGALFTASMQLGILAAGQKPAEHKAILQYAENIGYVFQIVDDILDETSSNEVLGKPVGSDKQQGKSTYINLYGLETAREHAVTLTRDAISTLEEAYGDKAGYLCSFAQQLADRIN